MASCTMPSRLKFTVLVETFVTSIFRNSDTFHVGWQLFNYRIQTPGNSRGVRHVPSEARKWTARFFASEYFLPPIALKCNKNWHKWRVAAIFLPEKTLNHLLRCLYVVNYQMRKKNCPVINCGLTQNISLVTSILSHNTNLQQVTTLDIVTSHSILSRQIRFNNVIKSNRVIMTTRHLRVPWDVRQTKGKYGKTLQNAEN